MYKFEKLEVWKLALDYCDIIYSIAATLPALERFNLADDLRRAANSIALNIAEGSTSQTSQEQARFLGMAIRSLVETVAGLRIVARRHYEIPTDLAAAADHLGHTLFAKLQAFRSSLLDRDRRPRERSRRRT